MGLEEDNPMAGREAVDEDGAEDNPDWSLLAKFARSQPRTANPSQALEAFIPKRGDKEFEPLPHLSTQQSLSLTTSRDALFSALSAGVRGHSSRDHVKCFWHPPDSNGEGEGSKGYGYVEGPAKGVLFASIGGWNKERKRLELAPEELLYLAERGTVECWCEPNEAGNGSVPMSVEWAWTEIIGSDGLSMERYQVYAYLKRLGYVVLRKRHVDAVQSSLALQTLLNHPHPRSPTSSIKYTTSIYQLLRSSSGL